MKKIISVLAAALYLVLCLMIPACAEEGAEEPVLESEGYRYRLLEDGTVEILKYVAGDFDPVLPDTLDGHPVTSIGEEVFSDYRYSVNELTIPASVTHIGSGAFSMTDLEEIEIPAGVVSMGDNPFSYCMRLKTITVAEGNPVFHVEEGVLFCREDHSLMAFPNMLADPYENEDEDEDAVAELTYTVPAGTEIIRADAFGGVECLSEIFLPDSLLVIGPQAFGFCYGLDRITIPDSVTEIGEAAFDTCTSLDRAVLPAGLERIPSMLFYECESLVEIVFPESLAEIGDGAFFCSGLEQIRIPDGVTVIEASAFEGSSSLKTVVIPDSVQSIGESAFDFCSENLVITCGPDSFTKTYCEQNGIAFRTEPQ